MNIFHCSSEMFIKKKYCVSVVYSILGIIIILLMMTKHCTLHFITKIPVHRSRFTDLAMAVYGHIYIVHLYSPLSGTTGVHR